MYDSLRESYFTTQGRLSRMEYFKLWVGLVLLALLALMCLFALGVFGSLALSPPILVFTTFVIPVFYFMLIVAKFCLAARRWHDLDCSGWMSLLFFVPGVNLIALLVLFFMSGTPGPNHYGPSSVFNFYPPRRAVLPSVKTRRKALKPTKRKPRK